MTPLRWQQAATAQPISSAMINCAVLNPAPTIPGWRTTAQRNKLRALVQQPAIKPPGIGLVRRTAGQASEHRARCSRHRQR
jgi:hypothetical protein